MTRDADVIVLGASIEGLAAAACLSHRGRRVLVIDDRPSRRECPEPLRWRDGRDLPVHGGRWIPVDPTVADATGMAVQHAERREDSLVLPPGDTFRMAASLEHLQAELQRNSAADARRLAAFPGTFGRVRELFSYLRSITPPAPTPPRRADWWSAIPTLWRFRGLTANQVHELLRALPSSARDFVEEWFETPWLHAGLCFRAVEYSRLGPRGAGGGLRLLHAFGEGFLGPALGTRQPLLSAREWITSLVAANVRHGTRFRLGARVAEILVDAGAVGGVRLDDGEVLTAERLISSLDPRHTLLELTDPILLPPALRKDLTCLHAAGTATKVVYEVDRLPAFLKNEQPGTCALLLDEVDDLERAADAVKYGRLPDRPPVEIALTDPADRKAKEAPFFLTATAHGTPYRLTDTTWGEARAALGERIRAVISVRDPGFEQSILHEELLSPADLETRLGVREGHLHHGDLRLDQYLTLRPAPDLSGYRTPVRGLYLCGPGTHPGGLQTGHSGCNAARELIADR